MSLRKTSCIACVSAKRRCDRNVPACSRCHGRSLECEYPYPLTSESSERSRGPENRSSFSFLTSSQALRPINSTAVIEDVGDAGLNEYGLLYMENPIYSPMDGMMPDLSSPYSHCQQAAVDCAHLSQENRRHEALGSLSAASIGERRRSRSTSEAVGHTGISPRRHRRYHRNYERPRPDKNVTPNLSWLQPTYDIWPRGRDIDTWNFCATELLSFVEQFATTATNSFILHPTFQPNSKPRLRSSLQAALGVCAAHSTLRDVDHHFFEHLLDAEVRRLIEASTSGGSRTAYYGGRPDDSLNSFREGLARLQAMTLYQIMGLFSPDVGRQHRSEQQEPLFASWTRELLLRIQALEIQSRSNSSSISTSVSHYSFGTGNLDEPEDFRSSSEEPHLDLMPRPWQVTPLQKEETESAYRTIVVSYLARSVHSALAYQTCTLLAELGSLPISVPRNRQFDENTSAVFEPGLWSQLRQDAVAKGLLNLESQTISYNDFIDLWKYRSNMLATEECDHFTILLLVACKGTTILNCRRD